MQPKTLGLERRVVVLMAPDMHNEVRKAADALGVSAAEYIRFCVQDRLDSDEVSA